MHAHRADWSRQWPPAMPPPCPTACEPLRDAALRSTQADIAFHEAALGAVHGRFANAHIDGDRRVTGSAIGRQQDLSAFHLTNGVPKGLKLRIRGKKARRKNCNEVVL